MNRLGNAPAPLIPTWPRPSSTHRVPGPPNRLAAFIVMGSSVAGLALVPPCHASLLICALLLHARGGGLTRAVVASVGPGGHRFVPEP